MEELADQERTREFMDGFYRGVFAGYGGEAKWAAEAGVRVDRDPVTGARTFVDIGKPTRQNIDGPI